MELFDSKSKEETATIGEMSCSREIQKMLRWEVPATASRISPGTHPGGSSALCASNQLFTTHSSNFVYAV